MRNWAAWSRFILEREAISFAWDASGLDCVRFSSGALLALTGIDRLGVSWTCERGALAQIRRIGKDAGLAGCVDTRLDRIAPAHAHRGDIAGTVDDRFGIRLMVIEGGTLVGPGDKRLQRLPRSEMIMAWSAGR